LAVCHALPGAGIITIGLDLETTAGPVWRLLHELTKKTSASTVRSIAGPGRVGKRSTRGFWNYGQQHRTLYDHCITPGAGSSNAPTTSRRRQRFTIDVLGARTRLGRAVRTAHRGTPGCDKSKLAGMLEALLAGHPALAPEVRQMLESGSDADDGAGAGTGAGAGAGAQ